MRVVASLLGLAILATGCASGSGFVKPGYDFARVTKVALIEVELAGVPRGAWSGCRAFTNQIGDFLTMEFFKKGYAMVERAQIEAVMKEQDFQHGDRTSSEHMAAIGRILNVPYVLVSSVTEYGENFSITSKMMESETGLLVWMGEATAKRVSGATTLAGGLLGAGIGAVTGGALSKNTYQGAVVGGVAGGVGGSIVGRAMEPQMANLAKDAIEDMCESLPRKS